MDEAPEAEAVIFRFNSAIAAESEKILDLKIAAVDNRIQSLVNKVTLKDSSILQPILGISHDKEELERLGRALLRVAPLVSEYDALQEQKAVFRLITDSPNTLKWMFGDFSDEVSALDEEMESLLNAPPPEEES